MLNHYFWSGNRCAIKKEAQRAFQEFQKALNFKATGGFAPGPPTGHCPNTSSGLSGSRLIQWEISLTHFKNTELYISCFQWQIWKFYGKKRLGTLKLLLYQSGHCAKSFNFFLIYFALPPIRDLFITTVTNERSKARFPLYIHRGYQKERNYKCSIA